MASFITLTKAKILELLSGKADVSALDTKADVSALAAKADASALNAHTSDTNNPHGVTKAQVGLGNADNTPDMGKPVSVAQQAALDAKADLDPDTGLVEASQLPPIPDSDWDSITDKPELNPFKHEIFTTDVPPELGLPPGTQMPYLVTVKADGDGDWFGAGTDADGDQIVGVATTTSISMMTASIFSMMSEALDRKAEASDLTDHIEDTNNPHEVTAAQVGLDKVQNIPSPMTPRWHPGQWYGVFGGSPTGRAMANPNQSQTVASPVWVPKVVTVDQISLEISTAGTAGQTFSLAIYDNDPTTDLPKNLLVATGNILGDTTGHKTESITPTVLQPGWNWLAYTANNGTMQCRGLTGAQPLITSPNPGGYGGGNPKACYVWNYITGGSTTSPPSGPSNRVGMGVGQPAPFIQVRCQP